MRYVFVAMTTLALAACGGTDPATDDFVPARDLSLRELANLRPEIERVVAQTPRPAPNVYRNIEAAVGEGSLDRIEADRLLLTLFFGDRSVPDPYGGPTVSWVVPDVVFSQIRARMVGYPAEVQQDLLQLVEANTGTGAGTSARSLARADMPWWRRLLSAAPVHAARRQDLVEERLVSERAVRVYYNAGFEATAARTADLVATHWTGVADFFQLNPFSVDVYIMSAAPVDSTSSSGTPGSLCATAGEGGVTPAYFDSNTGAIHVRAGGDGLPPCYLEGLVIHELFHKAHFAFTTGSPTATTDSAYEAWAALEPWLTEGAADWAVERFASSCNLEWNQYPPFVDRCTAMPLSTLAYDGSLFFTFVQQRAGLGVPMVQKIVRSLSQSGGSVDDLAGLLTFPDDWIDFSYSYTGYEAFDEQRLNGYPYEAVPGCLETYELGLEDVLPKDFIGSSQQLEIPVDVGSPAAQHNIVVLADTSVDWIDVALTSSLDQTVTDYTDEVRLTAVLVTDSDEEIQDWGESWVNRDRPEESFDLFDTEGEQTEGSFRICLQQNGPCADVPDFFPTLTEIRVVVVNAGTSLPETVRGNLLLLPGRVNSWEAEYSEVEPPEMDTP